MRATFSLVVMVPETVAWAPRALPAGTTPASRSRGISRANSLRMGTSGRRDGRGGSARVYGQGRERAAPRPRAPGSALARHRSRRPRDVQSADDADLPRSCRDHAAARRGPRGDAAVPGRRLREPVVRARLGAGRPRGPRRRARAAGASDRGRRPRDRVHERRDRGDQPRAQGRRVGRPGARRTDRHLARGAPRGRARAQPPREVRVRGRRGPRRPLRARRPGGRRRGDHGPHDPRGRDARQQRGGHDPARGRDRPGRAGRGAGSCSTWTPSRPRRGCRSTSGRWAPTSSRSPPTRRRARRERAPSGSGRGPTSWPSSTAARRSGTGGPAPRTSRAPSAWRPRSSSRPAERAASVERVRTLRDRLAAAVLAVDGVELTGHPVERLPHILSIVARGIDGGSVALALDLEGIAASTGSACSSGSDEVSHVLTAMGYPVEEARGALRLSLGRTTTDGEIDEAARIVPEVLRRLIGAAPRPSGVGRRMSRILVAMSGGVDSSVAAALLHEQGHEVVGVWMRLHDVADSYVRVPEELLLRGRGRRCPARRRPAGDPVLRHEPGAGVRRRRHRAVRRRLPRRPHAQPVRRLQHDRQVRRPARTCPAPLRLRGRRHRPLRAPPGGRDARTAHGPCSPWPRTRPRTRPTSCTGCARTSCGTAASRWAT